MRIMLANFSKMLHDSGGLAKVTVNFANEMHRLGYEVSLVFCDSQPGELFYPLEEGVHAYNLCQFNGLTILMPKWMILKREILRPFSKTISRDVNDQFMLRNLSKNLRAVLEAEKPDVIIASQPAATRVFIESIHTDIPIITMSHGDPEDYFRTYPEGELPALRKSAVCQVLLPSFEAHIKNHFPEMKVVTIGNVVPQYKEQADLYSPKQRYKVLFVGRLVKNHKRPHLLIKAFSMLADEFPDWDLELWGAESNVAYTKELRLLIHEKNLENRIRLMGTTKDIPKVLYEGDIFAMPSAYEGFGLSLAEAMSMGLPCVGYRSAPAVNELIRNEENGLLCENGVLPLAEALKRLMENQSLRVRYGNAARESVKQYDAVNIWQKWQDLIDTVIKNR